MISLGLLKRSSTFFQTDKFEVWDAAAEQFKTGFTGRLYPFDRFKTIYHRPTRRETLGVADETVIPASMVIRHVASQEQFIVGATLRMDSDDDKLYDRAYSLHRPSYLADLVRPTIQGSGDDLGPLVDVVVGKLHFDTELRTSERENDAYEKYKGQFFITMPNSYSAQNGDFLKGSGISFRLGLIYEDGGYQMARADNMEDRREVLTYKLPVNSGAAYDPATGVYTPGTTVDRLFSAIVSPDSSKEENDETELQSSKLKVFVDFDHIGFTPSAGNTLQRQGKTLTVSAVRSDPESRQWIMTCRRGR